MSFWKMTTCRETCLAILFVAVANSALECEKSRICNCQQSQKFDQDLIIDCPEKNNLLFNISIKLFPFETLRIDCINSPLWSDFRAEMPNNIFLDYQAMSIKTCQSLLNHGSEISRMPGAAGGIILREAVFFKSGNKSFVLEKRYLHDFENLKYIPLPDNNLSYEDQLDDLENLVYLNLLGNNLHLAAELFDHIPTLQYLELGDNDLRTIEPGTFDKLKNLTILSLSQTHLNELQPGVFDELVSLVDLDLHFNYLASLPIDVFAKLKNLQILNLSRNNFTHLLEHLLRNNTQLTTVQLSDNRKLTTLPDGFFSNLTKLKVLMLERNGFVALPEDLFWGSNSLTTISLNQNYLKTLPKDIFRDLRNLRELNLSSNYLEELPDYIFSKTNQLMKLDLSENRITSISEFMFHGLDALKELNMSENHLSNISDYIFSNTSKLVKLDLSKNRITSISKFMFHGLNALEVLNMDENHLSTIVIGSFNKLQNLKVARFNKNHLTLKYTISNGREDVNVTLSPFWDCGALGELYLARNNISQLFSNHHMAKHLLLDLSYNNITSIIGTYLLFQEHLKINLTHNKIQHIFFDNVERYACDESYDRDVRIFVQHIPLSCDCELYDFLRFIQGGMHRNVRNSIHIITEDLSCHNPKNLENMHVEDLKFTNLTCEVKNTDAFTVCPETCDCFLRPHDKTFIFDCSHKKLTSMPSDLRKPNSSFIKIFTKSIDAISQFELNFSDNRLTQMPNLTELGLESVEKLILSHNNISEISLDGLPGTIKVLELHNNNVSRVSADVLAFLRNSTNLTQMTLHENPWECDCDAKDFLKFIQTFEPISERSKVACQGNNNPISEMTDFCSFDTTAISGMSVAIALMGLIIGTIGLLYYKYQRQIKVWLFAHQWCLWFVTEEELDQDKLYDAFVSYSHKDHDFVVDELVSQLENGSTPFKLCLHYRDWLAGEWIPANIARSVEDSRRTIVVLSPNFLESIWGRMEFRAAHSQALSEGRARVILILYGDIGPTDDLDPELKAYISMNTYVKWGDPWFWDKLRYALPHQSKSPKSRNAGQKIFENHQLNVQTNEN